MHRLLRLPAIKESIGLSRSSIYLRIENGLFPHSVSLGGRAVGWPSDEVEALKAAWIAGRPETEIRELVKSLEASRVAFWPRPEI